MEGENFVVEPLAEMDFWTLYTSFYFKVCIWIRNKNELWFTFFAMLAVMFISY